MYIVALNGSHNKNGNTQFLLEEILKNCENAETEILNIHEIMSSLKNPFCISCCSPCDARCYAGTALEEAFEKITRADAVIIGSPVYFRGVSAQLKAFFDKTRKIRAEKLWVGKAGAAVSVGASKYGGQEKVISQIHDMMLVEGMTIIADSSSSGAGHSGVAAQRPAEADEWAKARAKILAERIMETC